MLYLDGDLVIDNNGEHPPRTVSGALQLASGPHDFRLLYNDVRGLKVLQLKWRHGDMHAHEPLPMDALEIPEPLRP